MKNIFRILLLVIVSFGLCTVLKSQNPEWLTFDLESIGITEGLVTSIAVDSTNNIWFNSHTFMRDCGGIIKYDRSKFMIYDTSNSDLKFNSVYSIYVDRNNKVWAGYNNVYYVDNDYKFQGGISIYENDKWKNVNKDTLNGDPILDINVDSKGNFWILGSSLLWEFGGTYWDIKNKPINNEWVCWTFPSLMAIDKEDKIWIAPKFSYALPDNCLRILIGYYQNSFHYLPYDSLPFPGYFEIDYRYLVADKEEGIWGCTERGLWKINNFEFTQFNNANSGLPCDSLSTMVIDKDNNKWLGSYKGLIKWDGTNWKHWNMTNSDIPFDHIYSIDIDRDENIWIGGNGKIAVFKEGGVTIDVNEDIKRSTNLVQNNPNPFSESTSIKYFLNTPENVNIDIYNSLGSKISTILNEFQDAGEHKAVFDGSNYPSGIYYYTIHIGERVESGKLVLVK